MSQQDGGDSTIHYSGPAPNAMNDAEALVAARQSTHGAFLDSAVTMQAIKEVMRATPNWKKMPEYQREALDLFAPKMGRIGHGDPSFCDHWDDVGGYATRVSKTIKGDLSP
jgi:hypothetical protein